VSFTSTPGKYIKYLPDDVAAIVDNDLFASKAASLSKLAERRRQTTVG
jgi:hypothetical protein